MSVITSVIVSIFAIDPAKEEDMVENVQGWALNHNHARFQRIGSGFGTGGGEKSLTCSLLIGAFDHFDTGDFRAWLAGHPLFDPSREYQQIDLMVQEVDREDFAAWRVLPIRERSLEDMAEEYKILNHLSEEWKAEARRIVEMEREACAKILEDQKELCRPNGSGEIKSGYTALHDAWLQIRARADPK